MDENFDFEDIILKSYGNWSDDYLNDLDTSRYPFPNTLWHIKSPKEIVIKTFVILLIAIPGIYMNSVILVIIAKNKWLWTPSNLLILNLASVDFSTLLLCPWFMLVRDFYQRYVMGNFGCRFEGFLQAYFFLANVLAVILVTYDRLAVAVLPIEARITKRAAPKLVGATWILSLILSTPWIFSREYVERQWLDYLETFCVEDPNILQAYWQFILFVLVWVPLGSMAITYGAILWRLDRSSKKLSSRGGGKLVARAKARTMRVAAVVLLADVICRIPYSALIYVRSRGPMEINWVDGLYSVLWFAANTLMYFNCTFNPIIYGFTNTRLLKAMDRTPGVACCKYGSWCCVCTSNSQKEINLPDKDTDKVFVIEASPVPKRKLTKIIKNILHIDAMNLSVQKHDEMTTKPTKVTPLKPDGHNDIDSFKENIKENIVIIPSQLDVKFDQNSNVKEDKQENDTNENKYHKKSEQNHL